MIDLNAPVTVLNEQLGSLHDSDLAVLFEESVDERQKIFEVIGIKRFAHIIPLINDDISKKFYLTLKLDVRKQLLRSLDLDELKDFIENFRISYHEDMLHLLPKSTQDKIKILLAYDGDTAAAISSPHYINLSNTLTIPEVMDYIIKQSDEKDEVDAIFFKSKKGHFRGGIILEDLIVARKTQNLDDIIDENYPFVYHDDLIAKTIKKIRDYDVNILPVLDDDDKLIGIISSDDALSMMEEEHLSKVSQMVKIGEFDINDSPIKRSRQRLPWLLISVVLNIIIALFLRAYKDTLDAHIALVPFIAMILGMSGNIGTQSIAVTIIGLHQDKVKPFRHVAREVAIGFINSLICGLISFGIVSVFLLVFPSNQASIYLYASVVGISLFLAMFISSMVGVLLPLILRKLGFDEKAASGPLISTVNDFTAVGTYLIVATLLLMNL